MCVLTLLPTQIPRAQILIGVGMETDILIAWQPCGSLPRSPKLNTMSSTLPPPPVIDGLMEVL